MTQTDDTAGRSGRDEPIRVLIVDDHALIRRSLELALAAEPDIEVVGEASDGQEAVEIADRLLPDVVLMDVRMPRQSGIEATRVIKASVPSARIVMLTVSDEEEDLFEAIKAGATGYLLKDVQIDEVPDAVRGVHEGQSLINPAMAAKLITEFANMSRKEAERPPQLPVPRLTAQPRVASYSSSTEPARTVPVAPGSNPTCRATNTEPSRAGSTRPIRRPPASTGIVK